MKRSPQNADQVSARETCILYHKHQLTTPSYRVRTLTGKEIELDIEPDYKVRYHIFPPHIPTYDNTYVSEPAGHFG